MTPTLIGGLDIETTGLEQERGHRIIEVAMSIHDLATGAKRGEFVTRINPERSIDPDAQAVHGIAFEELVACPTWPTVAPKLAALLARVNYVVAHNGQGFDLPFICHELLRVGVHPPPVMLVDTLLQGRWATPDGAVPNLGALCFACGVPYDTEKAHSALYDVDVMMRCFFSVYPRGFFKLPTEPFKLEARSPKKGT